MFVQVRLAHDASIPSARWCEPIGWEPVSLVPSNEIAGSEMQDGAWWDDTEQTAGLVWFGHPDEYGANEVAVVKLDDLRVASCGNCRVIGEVGIDARTRGWLAGKSGQDANPYPTSVAAHRIWSEAYKLAQRDMVGWYEIPVVC